MKRLLLSLLSSTFVAVAVATSYATPALAWSGGRGLKHAVVANHPGVAEGRIVEVTDWHRVHVWHGRRWWHRRGGDDDYNAPELDPGLLGSGAALFAASVLLLLERLRRE
jgi:hypothetical protein